MSDTAALDLAHKFITLERIHQLAKTYQPLYKHSSAAQNAANIPAVTPLSHSRTVSLPPPQPTSLSLSDSVLTTPDSADSKVTLSALQNFLHLISSSLTSINFSGSNITGRLFFRGTEKTIPRGEAADTAHIFIESRDSKGQVIVRDDISHSEVIYEETIVAESHSARAEGHPLSSVTRRYHYVSTRYDDSSQSFVRSFVEMNWLRLTEANLSSSDLSGHGLTAMICSTAATLTTVKVNDCPSLDNGGLLTLVSLCKKLRVLEFNNCPSLTEHGIMHLTELDISQSRQLELIACKQPHLSNTFCLALLHALEDRQFSGLLLYDYSSSKQVRGNTGNPTVNSPATAFVSPLKSQLARSPDSIIDLTFGDITLQTLQLLTHEQQEFFTQRKRALLESMTTEQRQRYADCYQQQWPFAPLSATMTPVYALDLSKHHYINNTILEHILQRYGSQLYVLKLSHTFISASGLLSLSLAPNLRVLSLSSCHGLVDKTKANKVMLSVCKTMPELMELSISDSRLSGQMMSAHPFLALFTFYAHACPISWRTLRLLSQTCFQSLSVLSLAHCPYLNRQSVFFIARFQRLIVLDVSHCEGLRDEDLKLLSDEWEPSHCQSLKHINLTGIPNVTMDFCHNISRTLTTKKMKARNAQLGFDSPMMPNDTVDVVCLSNQLKRQSSASFSLSSLLTALPVSHPYEFVQPVNASPVPSTHFSTATLQRINEQVRKAQQGQATGKPAPVRTPSTVSSPQANAAVQRYDSLSTADMSDNEEKSAPQPSALKSPHTSFASSAAAVPPFHGGGSDSIYSVIDNFHLIHSTILKPLDVSTPTATSSPHQHHKHASMGAGLPPRPSAPSPMHDADAISRLTRPLTLPNRLPSEMSNTNNAHMSSSTKSSLPTPVASSRPHVSMPSTPTRSGHHSRSYSNADTEPPARYVGIDEQFVGTPVAANNHREIPSLAFAHSAPSVMAPQTYSALPEAYSEDAAVPQLQPGAGDLFSFTQTEPSTVPQSTR